MSTQSLLTPPISTDQTTSLSSLSTPARPESLYASIDLQLGAGAVIVQPSSNKVVLLSVRKTREDEAGNKFQHDVYFLPKGRKDIGETLEECATREGYEESGYRCTLFPLHIPTHAPSPPSAIAKPRYPNTEPFYIHILHHNDKADPMRRDPLHPGENGLIYVAFWYMCQIPPEAVKEENTAMDDEEGYATHLLGWDEAEERMKSCPLGAFRDILKLARRLWEDECERRARETS